MTSTECSDDLFLKLIVNTKKLHTKPSDGKANVASKDCSQLHQIFEQYYIQTPIVKQHQKEFGKFIQDHAEDILYAFEKKISGKNE